MTRLGSRSAGSIVAMALLLTGSVVTARSVLSASSEPMVRTTSSDVDPQIPATRLTDDAPDPVGFSGPAQPAADAAPTGTADVAQQWFAHGRWWAVLLDDRSQAFHIWTLDGVDGPWVDTGTRVDERSTVTPDVAWTGESLFVVASGTRTYRNQAARISRFSFDDDASRWTLDPDFPVAITDAGVGAPLLTATDDGTIWVTYLNEVGFVQVTSSTNRGLTWSEPAPPPGPAATTPSGGFGTTAEGGELHIVWRPLAGDDLYVTTRSTAPPQGAWTTEAHRLYGIGGPGPLSVRHGGPLDVDALLVTAELAIPPSDSASPEPEILLVRLAGTEATTAVVARTSDDLDDPRVLLDPVGGRVRVVASSSDGRGAVYAKDADPDDLVFPPGHGTPVTNLPVAGPVGHPTVPDQPLDESSGAVVLATSTTSDRYATSLIAFGEPPIVEPYTGGGASGAVTLVRDTFDGLPLGGPAPEAWYSRGSTEGPTEVVRLGSGAQALELRADDEDTTRDRCRDFPAVDDAAVTIRVDVSVEGGGGADARLLTVRGEAGVLASARLSARGDVGWLTPTGRERGGRVPPGTPLRVTATLDPATRTYRMTVQDLDSGAIALEVDGTPWLDGSSPEITSACLTAPAGPAPSTLSIDEVVVTADDPGATP